MKKSIILLLCISNSLAGSTINLFLTPPPEPLVQEAVESVRAKLEHKGYSKLGKKLLKNSLLPSIPEFDLNNFLALYSGYSKISNELGEIVFPLAHSAQKVYLAITEEVGLSTVFGNTVSHLYFLEDKPAKLYSFERKKDVKNIYYWHVEEKPLPKNNRINPIAIVLLTKPRNIVVAAKDFKTVNNPNFILPRAIYVVGNSGNTETLLNFPDIAKYFEPALWNQKPTKAGTQEILITQ